MSAVINIDPSRIRDWSTFHDVFAETFGFPAFYGRNMDAWTDCMTSLDDPGAGLSTVQVPKGEVLTIQFGDADDFAKRCLDQYTAIIECSAFVNWRRLEVGEKPVLALSFYRSR